MKIIRLMVALATLMAVPVLSLASPPQPFDAKAFDTLTASGEPVVIAVHASWRCVPYDAIHVDLKRRQ